MCSAVYTADRAPLRKLLRPLPYFAAPSPCASPAGASERSKAVRSFSGATWESGVWSEVEGCDRG
jgi:hypothetical protein